MSIFLGMNVAILKSLDLECKWIFLSQTGSLKYARSVGLVDSGQGESSSRKRVSHWGRRKIKRRSRSNKYCTDDENDDDGKHDGRRSVRKGRRGWVRKRGRSLKRVKDEERDKMSDPEIEDGGPGYLEQVSTTWPVINNK